MSCSQISNFKLRDYVGTSCDRLKIFRKQTKVLCFDIGRNKKKKKKVKACTYLSSGRCVRVEVIDLNH